MRRHRVNEVTGRRVSATPPRGPAASCLGLIAGCAVCFQVEPNATSSGVHAAVITLMAVTVAVLGGVLLFLRRTKLLSDQPSATGRSEPVTGADTVKTGSSWPAAGRRVDEGAL